MLKTWLKHPLTRGLDINDPQTTVTRRQIIAGKHFLREIYLEWYQDIVAAIPRGPGPVLELGSGAGFMKQQIPDLIASEVFCVPGVDIVLNGMQLPFESQTLRAIVMTDVLHHIPDVRRFFQEASRCIRPGGAIVMIEPWVTSWSRLIYRNFHHEPFEPEAENWEFPLEGPLTSANQALPWILFERDRKIFEKEFPAWQIQCIRPLMPFRYLLSGGVSLRNLMPSWTFGPWKLLEKSLQPCMKTLGMFAQVVLVKTTTDEQGMATPFESRHAKPGAWVKSPSVS